MLIRQSEKCPRVEEVPKDLIYAGCPRCANLDEHKKIGYFIIKKEQFEKHPLDLVINKLLLDVSTTCRSGVFVEKDASLGISGPLLGWGRQFWWHPGRGKSILCPISRMWVKTWLLVYNRLKVLPSDIVKEIVSWVANVHTCHTIVVRRGGMGGRIRSGPVMLEDSKQLGVNFSCNPDFSPYPTCYGHTFLGTSNIRLGE